MSKFQISIEAECPFYTSEDKYKIRCEGLWDGSTTHIVFPSPQKKKRHKQKYCCTNYKVCMLAKTLYTKYGDDEYE